jgi:hypothetical protein
MGYPSLLVNEELARAIRSESALALRYWWGASAGVVHRWRKALGVTRTNNEGTHRLIQAAAEAGGEVFRGVSLPEEWCEQRRQRALEHNYGAFLPLGYHGPWWTEEELALLGTASDEEIAARIGRTTEAVRIKRTRRKILNPYDQRRSCPAGRMSE